jgi:uncharacterized protein YndB with AHSA1/START domain
MAIKCKPNEICLTRVYDAPVKIVWDAWTDTKKTAMWWGPRGFTLTTHSKDLRPGGHWSYTMHGPDGTNYENKTIYFEVESCKRLVYDHGGNDDRPPLFKMTATFVEENAKTTLELQMAFENAQVAEQMKEFIKQANGNSTWDRLAEFLANDEPFVINRSFPASINNLFEAWTNPKEFSQWLPPTGFSQEILSGEIKAGETIFHKMTNGTDVSMYGKIHYLEIQRPYRLIYTQIFTDDKGKLSRHPFAPTWPATMLTTVTFAEEAENKTRVTVNWLIHGDATDAERETFKNAKSGMAHGWGGSFDKLDSYLNQKLARLSQK